MTLRHLLVLMLSLPTTAAMPIPAAAEQRPAAPRDIGPRDPVRPALLNALRPEIQRDLGQPVKFVVRVLRVQGKWSFAHVIPQTPNGKPIDFMRTRHAERMREGMFDGPDTFALLENKGGRWTLRAYAIGTTDVAYADWPDEFGAPNRLFGLPEP